MCRHGLLNEWSVGESGIVVVAVEWINATKEGRQVEMEYSVCSERERE